TGAWYWYAKALKAETLWVAAKKAGMTVGSVGWPVTVGADIDYNVPEIWDPSEHPPTGKRTIENSTPGLIDKIIAAGSPGKADDFRTNATEFIIKNYRPNLVLLHLFELDDTEHKFGPLTPQAFETMEKEDGYIGGIVQAIRDAGIADKTTFFIVSDHGFAAISKTFEPDVLLVKAGLITLGPDGKPVSWKAAAWADGGSCGIVLADPKDKETEKAVTELFSKLVTKPSSPVNRVIPRKELDQLEAMPQAVIMLDANPGFTFEEALTGPSVRDSRKDQRGTHGYLPSRAEMRSSLIVFGEDARVGERVSVARMIDIGPTAAAVLGLDLADSEGAPLAQMVKPGTIQPLSPEQRKEKRSNRKKRNTGKP
ncbi:MAG: alkaline phosphatase family protein, partial [Blastocatellia bacterium]